MIIDATDQIKGRLASYIAIKLLEGEEITVVNCDRIWISCDPKHVIDEYKKKFKLGSPRWGPFYPRTPATMMRRAVRGMLPYKKERGRAAFSKLLCFSKLPKELEGKDFINPQLKGLTTLKRIRLGSLCKRLGTYQGKGESQ